MRLTASAMSFPKSLTLGAIKNNALIKDMGKEIAQQLKRLGVHINFAPVADINNNPENPVINVRSFGENRENVALKATAYMFYVVHVDYVGAGEQQGRDAFLPFVVGGRCRDYGRLATGCDDAHDLR